MDRITRKSVDRAFELFCKHIPAPEGKRWVLEANRPGDGRIRYCLGMSSGDPNFYHTDSYLGRSWSGSAEAFEALTCMWRTAEYLSGQKG